MSSHAAIRSKRNGSTNVHDIADTAGISIGLLYWHYKSKETLFDELVVTRRHAEKHRFFEAAVSPKQAERNSQRHDDRRRVCEFTDTDGPIVSIGGRDIRKTNRGSSP
ncbi:MULTISPECIES: helix-turn-helix domain-containing protein [Brevibacillus]|uniref:helix-turn-helix domain-containing protein n=1 Tax=Brevibacillus TaxID=55080 RepID=UPI003877D1E7